MSGLEDHLLSQIIEIFRKHEEVLEAKLFGSRAKGNYSQVSDIDIALFGPVDSFLQGRIFLDLEEIKTVYQFDLQVYNLIENEDLKSHIDRVGISIYRRDFDV